MRACVGAHARIGQKRLVQRLRKFAGKGILISMHKLRVDGALLRRVDIEGVLLFLTRDIVIVLDFLLTAVLAHVFSHFISLLIFIIFVVLVLLVDEVLRVQNI